MTIMADNLISYLIPSYNDQQALNRTLESIFQAEPLADILVVDDGSKNPVMLGETPDGFRVTVFRKDQNAGLIAALNTGIEEIKKAGYKYIARLDSGDTVNRGRLKAQLEFLEENPDVGIVGTQMRAFDPETDKTLFFITNPTSPEKASRKLRVRNSLAHPSVMIRTEAFEKAGLYDENFKYAEDYEMWRRIAKHYKVANLPEIYVNKEIVPHQITAQNRSRTILRKLKAQIKYFCPAHLACYIGIMRSLVSLIIPRGVLIFINRFRPSLKTPIVER